MRTIICAECGQTVEILGYARNVKYCPDCRKKVTMEKDRIRSRQRWIKESRNKHQATDTTENIAICNDCPLKECHMRSVACPLYRRKGA